jgi:hypothetical protein
VKVRLPLRVRLGACVPDTPGSDGWLTIDSNTVAFEWSGFGRRITRQIPKGDVAVRFPVGVFRARLQPPWANSGLILRGEDGTFTVFTFWGRHRRVVRALAAAEIPTVEIRTWFSLGDGLAREDDWAPS